MDKGDADKLFARVMTISMGAKANRDIYRAKIDIAEEIFGNRFGFYRPPGGFFLW